MKRHQSIWGRASTGLEKIIWFLKSDGFRRHPVKSIIAAGLWEYHFLFKDSIRYRFANKFDVTLRKNEGVSRLTYYFGVSEPEIFPFYDAYLRPGMVCLDVGANIGFHTLYMAMLAGMTGAVVAFEPEPENYRRLRDHVAGNAVKQVRCVNRAVGSSLMDVYVNRIPDDTARSYVSECAPSNMLSASAVRQVTLDRVCEVFKLERVDFLKIDAEGFEAAILHGAGKSLQQGVFKVIQIEVNKEALAQNSSSEENINATLKKNGYLPHY
jgi:FkbM family methyltransferase